MGYSNSQLKKMKLKTIIGTALLAGTCALPANAQIGEQRHNFSVGINGGINLNSVSFSPRVRQNNLMGINGGVTARYISEKYFSMICGAQIELNFSQHGWDEFYEDYRTAIHAEDETWKFPSLHIWHSVRTEVCSSSSMPVRR